jgi:predicted acetyltransferase
MSRASMSRVDSKSRPAFLAFSQHYEAEFSRITGKLPDGTGHYEFTDEKPGKYEGWMLSAGSQISGFAVIDISRERFDVAEFYIIPTHRRSALGREFASALFDHYKGPWQVRQIKGAEYARAFWVDVIRHYSRGQYSDEVTDDPEWGEVYIQIFESRSGVTNL